jgi:hypothetical protein
LLRTPPTPPSMRVRTSLSRNVRSFPSPLAYGRPVSGGNYGFFPCGRNRLMPSTRFTEQLKVKPLFREHWCLLPIPLLVAAWALLAFFVLDPRIFGLRTGIMLFSKFALAAFLLGGVCAALVRWAGDKSFLRPRCPKCRSPMHERLERTVRFECMGCEWAYDTGKDYSWKNMPDV